MNDEPVLSIDFDIEDVPVVGDIVATLEKNGFFVQKVSGSVARESMTFIGNNTLEELMKMAKQLDVKVVFVDESHLDKNHYVFDTEGDLTFPELEDYNKHIDDLDFNEPFDLYISFIYEGSAYGIVFENHGLQNFVYDEFSSLKMELGEKYRELMQEENMQKENELNDKEDELVNLIAEDIEFRSCTNQQLRVAYLKKFISNPDNKEYMCVIDRSGYGCVSNGTLKYITDRAWSVVKTLK